MAGLGGWDLEKTELGRIYLPVCPFVHPSLHPVIQHILSKHLLCVGHYGGQWASGPCLSNPLALPTTPTLSLEEWWKEHWIGNQGGTQAHHVAALCPGWTNNPTEGQAPSILFSPSVLLRPDEGMKTGLTRGCVQSCWKSGVLAFEGPSGGIWSTA